MIQKVGEKKFRLIIKIASVALILLSVLFAYGVGMLKLDYNFEKFFPIGDKETDFFLEHRAKFESDNDFLLISIENDPTVFEMGFLKKVKSLQKKLDSTKDVRFTRSIVTEKEVYIPPRSIPTSRPYINFIENRLARDEKDLIENEEMINTLIAKDKKSLCIFVRHKDFLSKNGSDTLVQSINGLCDAYGFDKVRVAGRTVGQKFYIDKMGYEMAFFMVLSYMLVIVFLFIAFRSLWGVLMPQLVILGTLFWVVGFIGLHGEPVSIVMSVLPCIVFVVAMSDVIHLLSRYLDAFRTGIGKFASIKLTIHEVGMATFLTSVTTAIGFFSLMFISVQPIQVFGAIAGFGVLIAFVLTFVLLPIIIYLAPNPTFLKKSDRDPFWKKKLSKWFIRVLRQPKRILIVYVGFIAVCLIGMVNLESNNFLMDEISQKEPIKQNFNFLDEHYGGIRPFELSISLKDTSKTFWSLEVLKDVEKVENYIEKVYGAGLRSSIVKVVKVMNRSTHTGRIDYYTLPERERDLKRFKRGLEKVNGGQFKNVLLDSTGHFARLGGNMPDWGNKVISKKNVALQQFLKKKMSNSTIKVQLTGTAHLLDKNISYLSMSLVKGISLSVILVALIMGLLYHSVSMVLISIIPNLIPLIFVAAIMGYFGINIKTSTAIVFTIAFGIAVDDTIHFLGKFKYELMKGRSKMYALKRSYLTTGKAMIITTFILCAGFILLVFSSFLGTANMGVLLCLTLFLALIVDLTLLPVLLMLFFKVKK